MTEPPEDKNIIRKRFWKRFLLWGFALFLLIAAPCVWRVAFWDIDEPELPKELQYTYQAIPAEDNWYTELSAAADAIEKIQDQVGFNKSLTAKPKILHVFEEYPPQEIILLRSAILSGKKHIGKEFIDYNTTLPNLGKLRSFVKMHCALLSHYHQQHNELKFDQTLKLLQATQMSFNNSSTLIGCLIDTTCHETILKAINNLSPTASAKQLKSFSLFTTTPERETKHMQNAIRSEFHIHDKTVSELRENAELSFDEGALFRPKFMLFGIKPNLYRKTVMPIYLEAHQALDSAWNQAHWPENNKLYSSAFERDWLSPSTFMNHAAINMLGPALTKIVYKNKEILANARLLKTKLACLRFKIDHGKFPQTLTDLLPTYLNNIPTDPFDGKAIRFNNDAGILYCISADLIDDKGLIGEAFKFNQDSGDIVLPLVNKEETNLKY